jgi:ATP-binding cassette, subfamily A (ABC1), member 3
MQGSAVFANYEGTGVGLDASTCSTMYQDYSFNTALVMLLVDFLLFFVLGLYLDKVIPSDFG